MGQSLSNPIVDKHLEKGGNDSISYGVVSMQGWRPHMEDMHAVALAFDEKHPDWSFFAIFDGHAGSEASKYSSAHLLPTIRELFHNYCDSPKTITEDDIEFTGLSQDLTPEIYNLAVAVHDGFIQLDENMKNEPSLGKEPISCGTTALALVITPEYFVFANCGDSRAILSRGGNLHFQTKDRKPSDPLEKARIIRAGSNVSIDRVNGNLAVSRALGDFSFKTNDSLPPKAQAVSPEPTITVIRRDPSDEFAVLACDGIWDVLTSQDIQSMILNRLRVTRDPDIISSTFVGTALYLDSRDNMTFLLILLPKNLPEIDGNFKNEDIELDSVIMEKVKEIMVAESKHIGTTAIVKKINQELSPTTRIVLNYKIPLIVSLMDNLYPERDRSSDFQSPYVLPRFINSFQMAESTMSSNFGLFADHQNEDN